LKKPLRSARRNRSRFGGRFSSPHSQASDQRNVAGAGTDRAFLGSGLGRISTGANTRDRLKFIAASGMLLGRLLINNGGPDVRFWGDCVAKL
jgi:hypothetical protein